MSHRDRLMKDRYRERVLVTLLSGEVFDGLLDEVDDKSVVLAQAAGVRPDGERVKADGSVLLPRVNVAYIQKP